MATKPKKADAPDKSAPVDESIVTVDVTDLFSPTTRNLYRRYNPDELVRQKGLRIYKKMLVDEQVKAVTEFKCSAILARGYEFYWPSWCGELSDEDKKLRVEVFQQTCDQMQEVSFEDAMEGIASGFDLGFSVSEKVYGQIKYAEKTYNTVTSILLRDPETFEFDTDEAGIVKTIEQRVAVKGKAIDVDPAKVIRYVHRPKWDYVYGRSDIREAYRAWYAKDQLIKLWLLYVERFGGGIAVANPQNDTKLQGTAKQSLVEDLAKLASGRSIVMPTGVVLDIKFPSASDLHQKAAEFFDLSIAKAVLVPNLLGLSHTGQTGAYSQSETQLKVFFWTLEKNAARLQDALNKQLFKDIGDKNWNDGKYPLLRFKKATPEHIKWMIEQFLALVNGKAAIATEDDERALREALGMPPRTEKSEPIVDPEAEAEKMVNEMRQADALAAAEGAAKKAQAGAESADKKAADAKRLSDDRHAELVTVIAQALEKFSAREPAAPVVLNVSNTPAAPSGKFKPHGKLKYADEAQFNSSANRVAFAVIERNVESSIDAGVRRIGDLVARATYRTLGTDTELAVLIDADVSDIPGVQFAGTDVSKIKSASVELLGQGWKIGQTHAVNELSQARGKAPDTEPEKFARLEDKAASYFDAKAFRMAGDTSDQVKKIIQTELQNAVKNGNPIPEVRATIWDRIVAAGLSNRQAVRGVETDDAVNAALDALWLDDEDKVGPYLDTLVRTNVFESLNEARYNEFTDPALDGFVQAFEYAAIMDSSTTDICRELNGKVYSADSEIWESFRPPNHFNCRSVLVPITLVDDWNGKQSNAPSVEPAKGFK